MIGAIKQCPHLDPVMAAGKTADPLVLGMLRVSLPIPVVGHLLKTRELSKPRDHDEQGDKKEHAAPHQAKQIESRSQRAEKCHCTDSHKQ